jgi:hypothetical protein
MKKVIAGLKLKLANKDLKESGLKTRAFLRKHNKQQGK